MSEVLTKIDSPAKYLRHISTVCAYCGIILDENNKTIDHILPKTAGGQIELNNIIVCCSKCNEEKDELDIKTFLSQGNRQECFENYLKITNFNVNNLRYAEIIRNRIKKLKYNCSKTRKTEKTRRQTEKPSCFYALPNGNILAINETQAKILNYFLEYKHIQDKRIFSSQLGISVTELNYNISCINNLTGILPLSKVSENGITFNPFF